MWLWIPRIRSFVAFVFKILGTLGECRRCHASSSSHWPAPGLLCWTDRRWAYRSRIEPRLLRLRPCKESWRLCKTIWKPSCQCWFHQVWNRRQDQIKYARPCLLYSLLLESNKAKSRNIHFLVVYFVDNTYLDSEFAVNQGTQIVLINRIIFRGIYSGTWKCIKCFISKKKSYLVSLWVKIANPAEHWTQTRMLETHLSTTIICFPDFDSTLVSKIKFRSNYPTVCL